MIHAIIGKSASGKSTIEKEVVKKLPFLSRIVLDSTRLARENEVDGVDYYFITRDQFKRQLGDYVDYSCYNGWYYGINANRIDLTKESIGVFNPKQYYSLKDKYGDLVKGYYIYADGKERVIRTLKREKTDNTYECCRRYLADEEDFVGIEADKDIKHFENNGDIETVTVEVVNEILKEMQRRSLEDVDFEG